MIEAEDVIKALLSELEIYTGPTMRCFPGVMMANEWLRYNSKSCEETLKNAERG
jgi:hypothetical protein